VPRLAITHDPLQPWQQLADYEATSLPRGHYGATAVFVGTMRDFNDDSSVSAMTLEYYPGMTERHLARICDGVEQQYGLLDTLLIHRVGTLLPGEPIVLLAVWSAHRREAFIACRELMEQLKSKAPFWKREERPDGSRWVEQNHPG